MRAVFCSVALLPTFVLAQAPTSLDQARAHFSAAQGRVAGASAQVPKATQALRGCHDGVLQQDVAPAMATLEAVRKDLEATRRDTERYRQSLEAARRSVEAGRAAAPKAPQGPYVEQLVLTYAQPMDQQLVPLLDGYAEGMGAWAALYVKYGEFCSQGRAAAPARAEFVAQLAGEASALAKKVGTLQALASTTRESVPAAVAVHSPRRHSKHAGRR